MGLLAALKKLSLPPLVTLDRSDHFGCRRSAERCSPEDKNAYIKSENMAFARSCLIVDVSDTGAQLELWDDETASILLFGKMTLFFSVEQSEVDCAMAWRKGRRLGVHFWGRRRARPRRN